jgi:hypothetical protein
MTGRRLLDVFLSLTGAILGGLAGYYVYLWLWRNEGVYALVLPGGMVGIGCELLALSRSRLRGVLCGLSAVVVGLFCEWRIWPFKADESFFYLVTHVHQLKLLTQILIILGAIVAYWCGQASAIRAFRGNQPARRLEPPPGSEPPPAL